MKFRFITVIKQNIKISVKNKRILRYMIRPHRVQEAGKLVDDQ